MIRALALRTMACIRVERIVDYLCEPLHRTLKDDSPYVRKTAVLCVAKLFDISPDLVDENGFLDILKGMLADGNPMVVSNVIAALAEIHQMAPEMGVLRLDSRMAGRLVKVMADCSEWGQVTILDALAEFTPGDQEQLEFFIESILPRLQHVNPSIVLSAIKVLLIYIERLPGHHEALGLVKKKLGPALVTLLSLPAPELQFVAMRSIRLILQRWPDLLANSIRIFFCKYNDPLYVKVDKLQLIVQMANEENVEQIYPELADYAKEVDIEFVRRAIKAIGEVALKLPSSSHAAIDILLELAKTDVRYVAQEVLITSVRILRRFPDAFGRALGEIIRDPGLYDEAEARAALVWILGEYDGAAHEESRVILGEILEAFKVEPSSVQSELFSALLKLFIRSPDEMRPMIGDLIEKGKGCFESAEFRDRAIFYERLLKLDSSLLRSLNLAGSGGTDELTDDIEPALLAKLVKHLGSLASVYYKAPEEFLTYVEPEGTEQLEPSDSESVIDLQHPNGERPGIPVDLLGFDSDSASIRQVNPPLAKPSSTPSNLIDLLS